MKEILTITFITLTTFVFGQDNRIELARANIFYTASYKDKVNINKSISVRQFEKDTIINNITFKKYQLLTFTDYNKNKVATAYYETFENNIYSKLDRNLNVVHYVNYKKNEQAGTIFHKSKTLKKEYVDTRTSFPKDSLIPSENTPVKFFDIQNPNINFILSTDLKINQLEIEDTLYTKQLLAENILAISDNYKNNREIINKPKLSIGDELQLFYRRRWYNDSTGNVEFEDKQFKNYKYIRDTIINKLRTLIFISSGYNYLSGNEEQEAEVNCYITDSAYYLDSYPIPIQTFKTEMKLEKDNSIFLQAISDKKIGNTNFPIITQYHSNSPYRNYVLPYFPFMFIEFGNIEGFVSYLKINEKEYGSKRERTFITDKTNIRRILQISGNEIEISFFLLDNSKVEIQLSEDDNSNSIFKKDLQKGEHRIRVKTGKLKSKTYYNINFSYELKNGSGSMTTGFDSK